MAQLDTATTTQAATKTSVANPGPLGLSAFALTTFVLSMANANFLGDKLTAFAVLPVALTFGGTAQLLAGMWEFRTGNTFGATAFTSYGAFWIGIGLYLLMAINSPGFTPGANGLATILLGWTIFTGVMVIGAVRVPYFSRTDYWRLSGQRWRDCNTFWWLPWNYHSRQCFL
jgi:uncharacterized protein